MNIDHINLELLKSKNNTLKMYRNFNAICTSSILFYDTAYFMKLIEKSPFSSYKSICGNILCICFFAGQWYISNKNYKKSINNSESRKKGMGK